MLTVQGQLERVKIYSVLAKLLTVLPLQKGASATVLQHILFYIYTHAAHALGCVLTRANSNMCIATSLISTTADACACC